MNTPDQNISEGNEAENIPEDARPSSSRVAKGRQAKRLLLTGLKFVDDRCQSLLRFGSSEIVRMLIVFATLIGAFIALMTFLQVIAELSSLREDRVARREDAIQKSWERLLARAPGNIGKGAALSTLFVHGVSMRQADFSCRQVGGWNEQTQSCEKPAIFATVVFGPAASANTASRWPLSSLEDLANWITGIERTPNSNEFGAYPADPNIQRPTACTTIIGDYGRPEQGSVPIDAFGLSLASGNIQVAHWEDICIGVMDLSGAFVETSTLTFARLHGYFDRAVFENADLSFSVIEGTMEGMAVQANVSQTLFVIFAPNPVSTPPEFSRSWAWADAPPLFAMRVLNTPSDEHMRNVKKLLLQLSRSVHLCDPSTRITAPPDGRFEKYSADYLHRVLLGGKGPRNSRPIPNGCQEISWEDAVRRYPDRYRLQLEGQILVN